MHTLVITLKANGQKQEYQFKTLKGLTDCVKAYTQMVYSHMKEKASFKDIARKMNDAESYMMENGQWLSPDGVEFVHKEA